MASFLAISNTLNTHRNEVAIHSPSIFHHFGASLCYIMLALCSLMPNSCSFCSFLPGAKNHYAYARACTKCFVFCRHKAPGPSLELVGFEIATKCVQKRRYYPPSLHASFSCRTSMEFELPYKKSGQNLLRAKPTKIYIPTGFWPPKNTSQLQFPSFILSNNLRCASYAPRATLTLHVSYLYHKLCKLCSQACCCATMSLVPKWEPNHFGRGRASRFCPQNRVLECAFMRHKAQKELRARTLIW